MGPGKRRLERSGDALLGSAGQRQASSFTCDTNFGRTAKDATTFHARVAVHQAIPAGLGPKDLQVRAKESQPS